MKKHRTQVMVKQKNGRTTPITKLYINCPICGSMMFLDYHKKGTYWQRSRKRWKCQDKICQHSFVEESGNEGAIRRGSLDEELGILKPLIITK